MAILGSGVAVAGTRKSALSGSQTFVDDPLVEEEMTRLSFQREAVRCPRCLPDTLGLSKASQAANKSISDDANTRLAVGRSSFCQFFELVHTKEKSHQLAHSPEGHDQRRASQSQCNHLACLCRRSGN